MTDEHVFTSAFTEVFEDVLGWGVTIGDEDRPGTVEGWDSLAQIRIIHGLETRFAVRLPDEALLEAPSVKALRDMVRDRVAAD